MIFPVILLIVVLILVMMNMASTALNMPQLEAWARIEIRELIVSVIIIIAVLAIVEGSDLAIALSSYSGSSSLLDVAKNSVLDFSRLLEDSYKDAIKVSHYITLLSGFSFSYPVSFYYFSTSYMEAPYSAYGSMLTTLYQAMQGLSNSILIYHAIALLLDFFAYIGLYLLPIAFSLRVIPYTRSVGTTLIALCLAAYIIFPFSVYLTAQLHNSISTASAEDLRIQSFSSMKLNIPFGFTSICKGWIKDFTSTPGEVWGVVICTPLCLLSLFGYAACWASCWNYVTTVFYPVAINMGQSLYGMMFLGYTVLGGSAGQKISLIYGVLFPYFNAINNFVMLSYIDVILISTITYVGAKSISAALGGEYYLPGLQRLV